MSEDKTKGAEVTNDTTPVQKVSVELTSEIAERIEESVAKLGEKFEEKRKAFSFHGTAGSKAEMDATAQKKGVADFVKAVATGDHATARKFSDERANQIGWSAKEKAITIGGDAGSEFLVPTVFETEIHETFDGYDEIISNANVKTFNKPGHIFNLNELDNRVSVFYSDEDSAGLTSTQPTYSQPQIAIDDLIGATDITLDFLEDTEVDIMADLARQFGEGMAQKIQARLINGSVTISGVVTKGIVNTSGLNQVLLANPTSGYSGLQPRDIDAAWFSAISIDHFQAANKNGKFYMHPRALEALRNNSRGASSDKDYFSVFDPVKMTLLGYPVVFSNQMPLPTTTTSDPFIVYGDLSRHLIIRRKRGLTMKLNDSGTSAAGRNLNYQLGRELVVHQRIGHQVVLAEGLTVLAT